MHPLLLTCCLSLEEQVNNNVNFKVTSIMYVLIQWQALRIRCNQTLVKGEGFGSIHTLSAEAIKLRGLQ